MSVTADARVQTKDAGRCLAQLCAHLSEKAQRRPELGVRVESSETHGTVDFGWGRCAMRADANALVLRAEADDQEGLEQVEEFIARHLKTHAEAGRLTVIWRGPGSPVAAADPSISRRDTMRAFHRRARH